MTAKTRIRVKCHCASTATLAAFTVNGRRIGDAAKNRIAINVENTAFERSV